MAQESEEAGGSVVADYGCFENLGGWWVRHKSGENVLKTANYEIALDLAHTLNIGAKARVKEAKRGKETK